MARVLVPEWQQSMIIVKLTPAGRLVEGRAKPVVSEGVVPVEIGRTEDLVSPVGLVSVLLIIRHVRAVAGVMQHDDVALFCAAHELLDAVLYRFLRRVSVEQLRDVVFLEAVKLDQRRAQILHIVDAAPEVRAWEPDTC